MKGSHRPRLSGAASAAGGLAAGLTAGIIMAAAAMFQARFDGFSPWFPFQQMAAVVYGVDALIQGGNASLAGGAIHLVLSLVFGPIFGLAAGRWQTLWASLLLGLIYSVLIWAVATFALLPFVNPVMSDRLDLAPGWWLAQHLLFGVVLGAVTPPASRFAARRRWARREPEERSALAV